ncbi:rRNA adenine N(6)-methyltransferase [Dirofilaria immitis]|nr:rRNA adenine N(6)-methyltransferase [Dirofilaria immitis]
MHTLTPMKLNEQIISMRKSVEKARVRLCRRLIRQRKLLQKSKDEKKIRKVNRIIEETNRCKKICRDDVSKFALINRKSLHDLLEKGKLGEYDYLFKARVYYNIRYFQACHRNCRKAAMLTFHNKISVDERVLYKLACQEIVLRSVEEFRIKYPNWQNEVAFLLQRLERNTKSYEKDENFETKTKKLKDKTKSSEFEEISVQVLDLPKLELPKSVINKGQAVIKLLRSDVNQDNEYASISALDIPDRNGDVVLQENAKQNAISEADGTTRSIVPVKIINTEERRKDLECERGRKRKDTMILDKLGNDSSLKEVLKNTTKSLGNQNLHPSWIAKKQEHEALKQLKASCNAKRIVFDDD